MQTHTTRRAVLIGGTATAALAGTTAAAFAAIPSWMELKIEAHREARAEEHRIGEELDILDSSLDRSFEARPVLAILEDARGNPVKFDVSEDSTEANDEISAIFQRAFDARITMWSGDQDSAGMRDEMEKHFARRERNRAMLRAAEDARQQRREASGVPEAEARFDAAAMREAAALKALLAEKPRSLADVEARNRYLLSAPCVFVATDGNVKALMRSMMGGEA